MVTPKDRCRIVEIPFESYERREKEISALKKRLSGAEELLKGAEPSIRGAGRIVFANDIAAFLAAKEEGHAGGLIPAERGTCA